MKMATQKPEEIVVNPKEVSDEIEGKGCQPEQDSRGPDSPDGVDGLSPLADETSNDELDEGSESEEETEYEREAMPEGDTNEDLHALLAFSKSRLEKQSQPLPPVDPTQVEGDEDATSDNENSEKIEGGGYVSQGDTVSRGKSPGNESPVNGRGYVEEKKIDADETPPVTKDQAYFIQLAMKKLKEAEVKAVQDEDREDLRKVTEENVKQVAKANQDDEVAAENVKPTLPPKADMSRGPSRSENQELWALLNYSKKRLETGATPQVKKKGSVRGDDMSVSSKLSKSSKASKRSLGSKTSATKCANMAIEGGPGDLASLLGSPNGVARKTDAPFPDVTDNGDASVDGSVSSESEAKISDGSDNSDDEEESSSGEEQEEEDELPDFLQDNDIDKTDPEEAKLLYEAAKFKAASILSVSEENLTDLQMLQALAVAGDAARKGDDKFSTKRSLFKLNEAKIEDLKSFLKLGTSSQNSQQGRVVAKKEREALGWGIGRGRFIKKVGAVFQDIKEKCDEIDDKKRQERFGQPSNKEMVSAALLDLKAQVAEYEKIVTSGGKKS